MAEGLVGGRAVEVPDGQVGDFVLLVLELGERLFEHPTLAAEQRRSRCTLREMVHHGVTPSPALASFLAAHDDPCQYPTLAESYGATQVTDEAERVSRIPRLVTERPGMFLGLFLEAARLSSAERETRVLNSSLPSPQTARP